LYLILINRCGQWGVSPASVNSRWVELSWVVNSLVKNTVQDHHTRWAAVLIHAHYGFVSSRHDDAWEINARLYCAQPVASKHPRSQFCGFEIWAVWRPQVGAIKSGISWHSSSTVKNMMMITISTITNITFSLDVWGNLLVFHPIRLPCLHCNSQKFGPKNAKFSLFFYFELLACKFVYQYHQLSFEYFRAFYI